MVESVVKIEEKPKLNKKQLTSDILYSATKGLGGTFFKVFQNLTVIGEENIPIRGKAILTTISKNALRDMVLISQVTGRKIHFMVNHKLMAKKGIGDALKTLGMFRSTKDKDDKEPINKVFKYLNEDGHLVAMTPEAKFGREIQVKSIAGIIKFAIAANAPIIPIAIHQGKTKLFNIIPTRGLIVKIGTPIKVSKKLNREKFRDKRYELAEDIIDIIDSLEYDEEQISDKEEE